MIEPGTQFTGLNPKHYHQRYLIRVIETLLCGECHQRKKDNEECLEEKQGDCCICGTPTCFEHRSPSGACIVHGAAANTLNSHQDGRCVVCIVCADLPRDVQERVLALNRELNGV